MKNFNIEYSTKKFKNEKLEHVIITYDTKKITFYLKKDINNNTCIIGDNDYNDIIKNLMDYFNPGTGFLSNMLVQMFIPLQVKVNLNTFKIDEVYIKNNKIENELFSELELNENINIKYLIDPIANLNQIKNME